MIDAHHHLWEFDDAEFSWLDPSLRKSYLAAEFDQALAHSGITGSILVQARCDPQENDFLIAQAQLTPLIQGIVAWVDLAAPDIDDRLARLNESELIKGVREITQGKPDAQFLDNPDFNRGISRLLAHDLSYDLLIFEHQLESAERFVANHPEQPMVLDHCAKPSIRRGSFPTNWAREIRKIARHPNLHCKLSGLVTEIRDETPFSTELVRPYFDTVLEAFGPARIMFGSDWPVSLSGVAYREWVDSVQKLVQELTPDEQDQVLRKNAIKFYRLEPRSCP